MRYAVLLFLLTACAVAEPGSLGYRTFDNGSGKVTVAGTVVEPQRAVYAEVARCAGLTGDPDKVTWYKLDDVIHFPDGGNWYGAYMTGAKEIWYLDSLSMRHEILHDLVYRHTGRKDHPQPPFGTCAEAGR